MELSNTNPWKTCSACAGDYEDPDRTARPKEQEWDEEDFPVAEEMPPE